MNKVYYIYYLGGVKAKYYDEKLDCIGSAKVVDNFWFVPWCVDFFLGFFFEQFTKTVFLYDEEYDYDLKGLSQKELILKKDRSEWIKFCINKKNYNDYSATLSNGDLLEYIGIENNKEYNVMGYEIFLNREKVGTIRYYTYIENVDKFATKIELNEPYLTIPTLLFAFAKTDFAGPAT